MGPDLGHLPPHLVWPELSILAVPSTILLLLSLDLRAFLICLYLRFSCLTIGEQNRKKCLNLSENSMSVPLFSHLILTAHRAREYHSNFTHERTEAQRGPAVRGLRAEREFSPSSAGQRMLLSGSERGPCGERERISAGRACCRAASQPGRPELCISSAVIAEQGCPVGGVQPPSAA